MSVVVIAVVGISFVAITGSRRKDKAEFVAACRHALDLEMRSLDAKPSSKDEGYKMDEANDSETQKLKHTYENTRWRSDWQGERILQGLRKAYEPIAMFHTYCFVDGYRAEMTASEADARKTLEQVRQQLDALDAEWL